MQNDEKRFVNFKDDHKKLRIVRMGTSGALQENIPVDSLLISSFGIGLDGLVSYYEWQNGVITLTNFYLKERNINSSLVVPSENEIQKHLGDLIQKGAIVKFDKYFSSPEFYNKSRKLKLILEDFVSSVKEEFKGKLYSIVLFGSYAKDRAVKGSDIDVFILVKDKISADKIIREIYSKYGMEINVVMLDLKELEQQKNKEFFKEIISNHYIIYGTDRFTEIMK